MNKELATNWVKALRSGLYKQGKNNLIYNDKYCCLGVLCEVYGLQKITITHGKGFVFGNKTCITRLDSQLKNEVQMTLEEEDRFISYNDMGKPFTEIADYIEKTYLNDKYPNV